MQTIKKMQSLRTAGKQKGFTIIELVVVILLLGILAATALPRFIDVTEEAHQSAYEAVRGGLSTGLALYRAQWIVEGQPAAGTSITEFGGLLVAPGFTATGTGAGTYTAATAAPTPSSFVETGNFGTTASGYPYGTLANLTTRANMTAAQCKIVFDNLLQAGAPSTNAVGVLPDDGDLVDDVTTLQAGANAADFQIFLAQAVLDTGFENNSDFGPPAVPTNASGNARNHEVNMPVCVYLYAAEPNNFGRAIAYAPWTGDIITVESATNLYAYLETELASPLVP